MIPRTLVPMKISPVEKQAPGQNGHRRTSALDSRIVVPSELPAGELDARTSIPVHLPLDVLASRMLIPRDMPVKRMAGSTPAIPTHVPLEVLGTRTVVPAEARLEESFQPAPPMPVGIFADVLEPDLFTTGEVNLLASPEDPNKRDWHWVARSFSLIVHVTVIFLILFAPKLFTANQPAQEAQLARQQLSTVFLPPEVKEVPRIRPLHEQPSDRIRLDPRILKKLEPPVTPAPEPLAGPKTPAPPQPTPAAPAPQPPPKPVFKALETPPPPPDNHHLNLDLPEMSPGKELEQSAQQALRNQNSGSSAAFSGTMPQGAGQPSGADGQGMLGSGVQILTPTDGVDFSNYLTRLLARVKQNWESVMPISARMGDKGVVVMQFHIMRNGNMPPPEPVLERTSGKEPLDRAAGAALTESNPFEPLPSAYTRPYIELRIIFLYNLPLNYNLNQ
ncbi:MAG: TonB C-terminal domain-containing protein [Candidatus Acidiferrales bacterium]